MRTATARDGRWSRAWDSSCRTSNISLLKANARTGSRKSSKPSGGAGGTRLSHRRVSSRSTSTVRRCSPNRCVPGIRLPRSAPSARQPALEPATLRLRPTRRNGCNGRRRMPHGSTRCTTRLLLRRTPRPGGSFFASLQRSMPTPTRGRSTPTAAGCSPRNSQPTRPRDRDRVPLATGLAPVQAGQGRRNVYAAIVSGVSIRSQAPRTALCASGCRWA